MLLTACNLTPLYASGGLPIRQKRQLPKARHGAGARPVHCEFFKYLINNLVSDFVTQLAPQPPDQPASQLFKNSQNTNQLLVLCDWLTHNHAIRT